VGFLFFAKTWKSTVRPKQEYRRMKSMAEQAKKKKVRTLSLDGWAVAIALLLAALVRLGVLKHIGW